MSSTKRNIRENFRRATFTRDKYVCRVCVNAGKLDAHHITDRHLMPNGGYVPENGISLCERCHLKAEARATGFEPEKLYEMINSSHELAVEKSKELDGE